MQIVSHSPEHFPAVVAFLRENWAAKHPLYDRALFDWQYRTSTANDSLLIVEDGRVLAFLGNIPGRYSLDGEEISGVGLTMWCVAREMRNSGLGVRLFRAAEKVHRATLTLGAGLAVLPMYQAMGYSVLPRLHRYVLPLEVHGFERLLTTRQPPDSAGKKDDLSNWHTDSLNCISRASPVSGPAPDADTLAGLYDRSIRPAFRFSQIRHAAFWQWRYIDNAGFRYHRFGSRSRGAVIARIESVIAPQCEPVDGLLVLRLIEILPRRMDDWDAVSDVVAGVTNWAAAQGCVAADYQCVSSRPGRALEKLGFRDQSAADAAPVTQLGQLFGPFRPNAAPINFVWKALGKDGRPVSLDPDDCYFVKSDCDMDRPAVSIVEPPTLRALAASPSHRAQAC